MKKTKTAIIIFTAILALCASCNLDPTEPPTVSVPSGPIDYGTSVTLTASARSAKIRYTLDGTDPTYESMLYKSPIQIIQDSTLKAAVFKSKQMVSVVVTAQYSVKVASPTSNVASGAYGSSQSISLSCSTPNSTIYYTLDGTAPNTSSSVYSSAIELTSPIIPEKTTVKMFAVANGCLNSDVAEYTYTMYTAGPAGGYVFYDCDADNDGTNDGAGPDNLKSSTCGWRYLEAAPANITVEESSIFLFGFYKTSDNESFQYVNGTTIYDEGTSNPADGKDTGMAVGTGKANTIKIVTAMKSAAYSKVSGSETTANYAAKLCDDYSYGGYSDWFMPSMDELTLMYTNLHSNGLGGFCGSAGNYHYWSSSESSNDVVGAWALFFANGDPTAFYRNSYFSVRAIRSFLSLED